MEEEEEEKVVAVLLLAVVVVLVVTLTRYTMQREYEMENIISRLFIKARTFLNCMYCSVFSASTFFAENIVMLKAAAAQHM